MKTNNKRIHLLSIFWPYLLVGSTAFGFSVLQKIKKLVLGKKWLSETELDEGIALVQLYPGPIMVNLTTYIGYKLRGVPGAIASTFAFIIPTTVLMIVLSSIYFSLGEMPWIRPVFTGLEALVVGVLINVILDFGKRGIGNGIQGGIALTAFAVLVLKFNVVFLVLLALLTGALFLRPKKGISVSINSPGKRQNHWTGIILAFLTLCIGIGLSALIPLDIGRIALSFFKTGSIAFGNGLTILPLIQADVVNKFHWLTLSQFIDGIALSQITPGPFLVIATFIGFKEGGIPASLLTTFAIFSPSFVFTMIFTEVFSHVRNLSFIKGALAGVLAAFVGLLAAMILQLGAVIAHSPAALIFAAGAFICVRYVKLDILWIFAGGLALWTGLYVLGIQL